MAEVNVEAELQESELLESDQNSGHACKDGCSIVLSLIKAWWKLLVIILTPILLLPLPLGLSRVTDDQVRGALQPFRGQSG